MTQVTRKIKVSDTWEIRMEIMPKYMITHV
jgi:hypothetical protein